MFRVTKRGIAIAAGICMLSFLLAAPAHSQAFTSVPANPYAISAPTYTSPYWGYTYDPYGGYLHGGADVIRSQGQLMVHQQEAFLLREKVRAARLENRHAELKQWLWERETLPTPEDERQRSMEESLRRARNDPPITEIWSAQSLNDLLNSAKKIRSSSAMTGAQPLDPELLAKINVTSGKAGGNIGLIKDGRIAWPLLLRRKDFTKEREQIDQLVVEAVSQAGKGTIDAGTLESVIREVGVLQRSLTGSAKTASDRASWTFTMYMDAKSFLNQFDDAVKVLQQPDAASYLSGKYAAKGRTVAELVQYMADNGLRFAPVSPGGETAYVALQHALAAYDSEGGTPVRQRR
jgi:hypothetical protein